MTYGGAEVLHPSGVPFLDPVKQSVLNTSKAVKAQVLDEQFYNTRGVKVYCTYSYFRHTRGTIRAALTRLQNCW